jgi:hypothetical protein
MVETLLHYLNSLMKSEPMPADGWESDMTEMEFVDSEVDPTDFAFMGDILEEDGLEVQDDEDNAASDASDGDFGSRPKRTKKTSAESSSASSSAVKAKKKKKKRRERNDPIVVSDHSSEGEFSYEEEREAQKKRKKKLEKATPPKSFVINLKPTLPALPHAASSQGSGIQLKVPIGAVAAATPSNTVIALKPAPPNVTLAPAKKPAKKEAVGAKSRLLKLLKKR